MPTPVQNKLEMEKIRKANDLVQQKIKKDYVAPPIEWDDKIFIVVSRCTNGPQGWVGLCKVSLLDENQAKNDKKISRKELVSGVFVGECLGHVARALEDRMYNQRKR